MDRVPDEEGDLIRAALDTDYEILDELGRGGMAVVYRARERALERDVAIKVLPIARTFDAEFVARFQREARLSASLEHPHIVPVYRVGQSGRVNFFVMKYMQGPSLAALLAAEAPMEPGEVERILREVSEALDHAHSRGVVHRDVKPDNIMRDHTGRYVVMDFGIAKSLSGTQLTQTGGSIGTPKYMSPEQARGGDLDGRSDFYSLGVVAYQCFVGRVPFEGEDPLAILFSHLHDPVPEPTLDSADARRVYAVIRRMLAKTPDERAASAAAVAAGLDRVSAPAAALAHGPGAARSAREVTQWLRGKRARVWVPAAAVGMLLIVMASRGGAAARCRAAMSDDGEGARAVLLDQLGAVGRGTEIELSYVVCGLSGGDAFTARALIRPADDGGVVGRVGRFFGGGSDAFRESWDDEAEGFATTRTRTISPGDLAPGPYRITVNVESSGGRDAEASHEFTVVE